MATFTVTNLLDAGAGSLRQAILDANATFGVADTIDFGSLSGSIVLTSGQLTITDDLIIDGDTNGDDKADITIDANGTGRVFGIQGPEVDLLSLTMTGGLANLGGALRLYTGSVVDLVDSTISGNNTSSHGGGIYIQNSILDVTNSTIDNNTAVGAGGGIYLSSGTVTLTNTTVDSNSADGIGGGIHANIGMTLQLYNSTITNNHADAADVNVNEGGGISMFGAGTFNVTNTVIAQNISGAGTANDVLGTIGNATNSFIGVAEIITNNTNTTNGGGDPLLDALADNGGTVQTRAIQSGSGLIGTGDETLIPAGITTDANGNARVVETLDIGAVEADTLIVVDNLVDENDGDFSAGDLSLREALSLVLEGGTIAFADGLSGTINLSGGQLNINKGVTINGDTDGDGRADIIISGDANGDDATTTDVLGNTVTDVVANTNTADNSRVINLTSGVDVNLTSLVITGGNVSGGEYAGGGINASIGGSSLTIDKSTIIGNVASRYGGGIYIRNADVTITNSTIQDNRAGVQGGGVYSSTSTGGPEQTQIINTTIIGNTSFDTGGGVENHNGTVILQNSTVVDNRATNSGGGISSYGDSYTSTELSSTIVALNTVIVSPGTGDDIALYGSGANSFAASPGNNLIGEDNTGLFTNGVDGNIVGSTGTPANPGLAMLADNGGPVATMAPFSGSQVIDAGVYNALAGATDANGDDRNVGGSVDIGAVEAQLVVVTELDIGDDATIGANLVADMLDGGGLSLREAVAHAGVGDTITFDAALAGSTITLGSELAITQDVTIDGDTDGDDKADITVSGNDANRVFNMTGVGTDVVLNSLTLTNGLATAAGDAGFGGAIFADQINTLTIRDTTIQNSTATYGGGILAKSVNVQMADTLLVGNHATESGGGFNFYNSTTADLINVTVTDNTADNVGGGGRLITNSTLNLHNSTISGNQADADGVAVGNGGGIDVVADSILNTRNSVIAQNTSGGSTEDDINGLVFYSRFSFLGTSETIVDAGITGTVNGGGDAGLVGLADNGGTTLTMGVGVDSALIDTGSYTYMVNDALDVDGDGDTSEKLPLDANGADRSLGGEVDIGAVEHTAFVVDNILDVVDGDYSAGQLSLREAISLTSSGGLITFDASLSGQSIVLGSTLVLTRDVTIDGDIDGDNKADITLDGNNNSRIISVNTVGTDVDLLSLTLTNGRADRGGALRLYTGMSVDLIDSTISGNVATSNGGGIYNQGGILNVTNSTISDNAATIDSFSGAGGGMFLIGGTTTLTNTTLDGNSAGKYGGGIYVRSNGILNVNNSTIAGNQANFSTGYGGGIYKSTGTINITNSVVADNTSGGVSDDIFGTVNVATNSFIGTTETITTNNSSINGGGDPLLAALADNGGTVQTRAILNGSALVNAGDNGSIPAGITTDANGNVRIVAGTVDIGAVEANLIVTTELDTGLDNTIDGTLAVDMVDGGGLSLREAIGHAGAGDEITFAAALSGQTITLSGTELDITSDLTIDGDIDGDNKADITISGNDASRVFGVTGGTVNLISLDLTNGNVGADGGAVLGLNGTTVNIIASTIRDSTAGYGGGASTFGTMNIVNSTISGNTANYGGGLYVNNADTLNVINSTVYGNTATQSGGGIGTSGLSNLNIYNSTIAANSSTTAASGGGLEADVSAIVNIDNSIIANNTANGVADDVDATIDTADNSFFGTTETITTGADNINGGGDPLLGELLDNGGPVLTLSPLDGSPVIGMGNNVIIAVDTFDLDDDGDTGEALPFDGRGGARILDTTVDIGAVEQFEDETIRGTDGVNNIVGGDGDDVLEGKGGADNIDGGGHGANGDTVTYISSTGAVQVVLDGGPSTGNDAAGDVVTNVENIIGSNFGDVLTGNGNANFIDGGLGNDTLNGLGGNDILVGDFNQDTLNGGDDDDDLDGGAGNDIIDGGAGIDTGRYDSFGGAVIINLNLTTAQNTGAAGTETISNVENLIGGIGNDRFTGKVQVSVLEGGGGSDSLFGLGGDDILRGGEGNDNAQGGNGLDTLIGGNGRDTLVGGAGIDTINGDAGKDVIRGGDDGDIIDGGADRDVLIGGDFTGGGFPGDGAADTFVFSEVSDSAFGGATRDIIRDFEQGLDVIDLSAIDAITGGSDDAFTFIGTSNFSGTAGELRAFSIGGNTDVRVDVDGDGTADMEIFLNGTIAMTTGDFVL